MKTCQAMQKIITAIAAHHGLDLTAVGAHLKLEMRGYMPLVVEVVGDHMVSVAHFFIQEGDVMYDPEVVYYMHNDEWLPMSITQAPAGIYREVLFLGNAGTPERFDPRGVWELAEFSAMWASNIEAQGWLTATKPDR